METVLLVIHLMIAVTMVGVVLMQQSEGGALGMGGGSGGGGGGGFLTGRGTANVLTRTTAGLAAAFFLTSITLTVLARGTDNASPFDATAPKGAATTTDAPATTDAKAPAGTDDAKSGGGLLDALESGQGGNAIPAVPQSR